MPEEDESSFLREMSLLHEDELPQGDLRTFEEEAVEKILDTFDCDDAEVDGGDGGDIGIGIPSSKATSVSEQKKIIALLYLSKIVNSFMSSDSPLGRVQRHENQTKLLNVFIRCDGLARVHAVQGKFKEQRFRTLASHVLAKVASKIYEGWN